MISTEILEGFNKRFDVVSLILEHDGHILMLHRQDSKPQGNTWSFPAGKVEQHESDFASALAREIREETEIELDPASFKFLDTYYVRHDGYDFAYHVFKLAVGERPEIRLNEREHKDYGWFRPHEALELPLMPDEDHCLMRAYPAK